MLASIELYSILTSENGMPQTRLVSASLCQILHNTNKSYRLHKQNHAHKAFD